MTIKVIMERTVEAGKQDQLLELLKQLRARALMQPGYVSGETLTSVDRAGTHLVISTWHSLYDWKAWETHPERQALLKEIDALLTEPSKVGVFMESRVSLPEGV
ncbi:MAG: antibiotic biosynthesis monooxygenase family protein [Chloroflexota bacterium]|nr:antibiotic biosynthesis monooxygenase family protein [Chloroflexota bacterium]